MYEFIDYCAEDVMTRQVETTSPGTPLFEIDEILERRDFNGLPVVDAEGKLLGLVTKLDVLRAFRSNAGSMFLPYEEIMKSCAASVMSRNVQTLTPLAPLTRVLDNLVSTGVKSLPVVDRDRIVGIVSREDVLSGLRRACRGTTPSAPTFCRAAAVDSRSTSPATRSYNS
jgi:CBS domain-containing protein